MNNIDKTRYFIKKAAVRNYLRSMLHNIKLEKVAQTRTVDGHISGDEYQRHLENEIKRMYNAILDRPRPPQFSQPFARPVKSEPTPIKAPRKSELAPPMGKAQIMRHHRMAPSKGMMH